MGYEVAHGTHSVLPPTGSFCCLLRRFSRAPQSTNLCFEARTRPAAAAAVKFCGGLLNRLAGSRWAGQDYGPDTTTTYSYTSIVK
jgi:hypothetical protein